MKITSRLSAWIASVSVLAAEITTGTCGRSTCGQTVTTLDGNYTCTSCGYNGTL